MEPVAKTDAKPAQPLETWAIVEVMGHRRYAGHVSELQIAGAGFIRVDVPAKDGKSTIASPILAPASIFCITPCTEEIARRVAAEAQGDGSELATLGRLGLHLGLNDED